LFLGFSLCFQDSRQQPLFLGIFFEKMQKQ